MFKNHRPLPTEATEPEREIDKIDLARRMD